MIQDKIKELKARIFGHTDVLPERDTIAEEELRKKINNGLNYDLAEADRRVRVPAKSIGNVESLYIWKMPDGSRIQDVTYSKKHSGFAEIVDHGFIEKESEQQRRIISVTHNDGSTEKLEFRKETGLSLEHGTVGEKPKEIDISDARLNDKEYAVSLMRDIDLNDTNALRHALRLLGDYSSFMDRYALVLPEDKKAYKDYEKANKQASKQHINVGKILKQAKKQQEL